MRSPSRRWNKSKLSFSTWTVSTWESSSWDVWNSRNWWYVWDIYIYILYNYIEFISYLYIYIYIYHISSFSANCNCWGYRCNPIFRRTSQDDFRDGMYQLKELSAVPAVPAVHAREDGDPGTRLPGPHQGSWTEGPARVQRGPVRWDTEKMGLRRHQTACETRKHQKALVFCCNNLEELNWNGSTWDLSRHRSKTWSMSTRRRNDRWTTPGTTTFRKSSWTEGLGTMAEESSESDILSYFVEICWNLSKSWASIFDIAFSDRFTPRKPVWGTSIDRLRPLQNPTVSEARDALGAASPDEQGWPTSWDHSDCKPHLCRHWRWFFFRFKCSKTCSETKLLYFSIILCLSRLTHHCV